MIRGLASDRRRTVLLRPLVGPRTIGKTIGKTSATFYDNSRTLELGNLKVNFYRQDIWKYLNNKGSIGFIYMFSSRILRFSGELIV